MLIEAGTLEKHRRALSGHCYRMMGSVVDADDAVQETLTRAWSKRAQFDSKASLSTWLYRIATNVCLDALSQHARRARPIDEGPTGTVDDVLETKPRAHWLEPVSDAWAIPPEADPAQRLVLQQSIRLAFVAALQHLPAKQRAVLLLTEVLGWSAAEVAQSLELSVASVNSALQRARATLQQQRATPTPPALNEKQLRLVEDYCQAFLRYDVDALVSLLQSDAVLSMPPYSLWLQGPDAIRAWLSGRGSGCRGSKLLPISVNGLPAFAQYRPNPDGGHSPWAILVLELSSDAITSMTSFLDTETLFPRFGLPNYLPA